LVIHQVCPTNLLFSSFQTLSKELTMPSIPRIKKSDITRWTDETYFQRGLKYYEQGAIYDQQCQGMTL
jgi:uncharacterized Zn finger protein